MATEKGMFCKWRGALFAPRTLLLFSGLSLVFLIFHSVTRALSQRDAGLTGSAADLAVGGVEPQNFSIFAGLLFAFLLLGKLSGLLSAECALRLGSRRGVWLAGVRRVVINGFVCGLIYVLLSLLPSPALCDSFSNWSAEKSLYWFYTGAAAPGEPNPLLVLALCGGAAVLSLWLFGAVMLSAQLLLALPPMGFVGIVALWGLYFARGAGPLVWASVAHGSWARSGEIPAGFLALLVLLLLWCLLGYFLMDKKDFLYGKAISLLGTGKV